MKDHEGKIAFVSVTGSFLLARRFLGERLASGRPLGASSV